MINLKKDIVMSKVLVLNADYTPLNVTSLNRGFKLVYKGKAEVVKKDDKPLITTIGDFIRPIIIRLFNYVRHQVKPLKLNRKRIYRRDNFECVYCGSKKNLTIDHVIPRSKGGKNTWDNLVTCCSGCNLRKGDKSVEESGFKMKRKPFVPSIFSFVVNDEVEDIWENFKLSFV
jgi:CRISPR/Cas system Type II protein with McrA/HNH and RuvC-like nuclease domain